MSVENGIPLKDLGRIIELSILIHYYKLSIILNYSL